MWKIFAKITSLLALVFFLITAALPTYANASATAKRIVSLAPDMTEMLFALGLGKRVVGVTTFCDHPKEALSKPKIGGMSNPSLEAIIALKPDLVVMTDDGNSKAIADRLAGLGIKTYIFRARRLTEIPEAIRNMGKYLGVKIAADTLSADIDTAIMKASKIETEYLSKPYGSKKKRSALFVIWFSPLIVAGPGTIIDDAMKLTGLINIAADTKIAYPRFSLEAVINRKPELILIGKGHADIRAMSKDFLKAVNKGRVCYLDDALYRPGPRIPAGINELISCGNMP